MVKFDYLIIGLLPIYIICNWRVLIRDYDIHNPAHSKHYHENFSYRYIIYYTFFLNCKMSSQLIAIPILMWKILYSALAVI